MQLTCRNTRVRALVGLAVGLVAMTAVGCSTKSTSQDLSAADTPSSLGAAGGVASSTTAPKPTTTMKGTPECWAMVKFNYAQLGLSADPKNRGRADYLDTTAAELKKAVPQFSGDVDTMVSVAKKAASGANVSDADKEKNGAAGKAVGDWWRSTCL